MLAQLKNVKSCTHEKLMHIVHRDPWPWGEIWFNQLQNDSNSSQAWPDRIQLVKPLKRTEVEDAIDNMYTTPI